MTAAFDMSALAAVLHGLTVPAQGNSEVITASGLTLNHSQSLKQAYSCFVDQIPARYAQAQLGLTLNPKPWSKHAITARHAQSLQACLDSS